MAGEGLVQGHSLGLGEGVDLAAAPAQHRRAGSTRRLGQQRGAVPHQGLIVFPRAIPFQHGELWMVQRGALAIAEDPGEIEQARLAGRQQLLGGEFRRGVQIIRIAGAGIVDQHRRKAVQMRLVPRRDLQDRGLDLDEVAGFEPAPQRRLDPPAREQSRAPVGMDVRPPEGRVGLAHHISLRRKPCKPACALPFTSRMR